MRLIISSIGTTLDTISTIGYHWCSKRPLLAQFSLELYSFPLELKLCSFPVHTQRFNCNVLNCAGKLTQFCYRTSGLVTLAR